MLALWFRFVDDLIFFDPILHIRDTASFLYLGNSIMIEG
jgi:hypothetical protein